MPNRILKESICSSENIDRLSAFQETFFYRLMVNCDDYGRMDARPKILASRLFPLKDVRTNQVEDALRALTSAELVILYEVDGQPFLQMKTWDKHQQVRAKRSKYPSLDIGMQTSDSICKQMQADDSICPRNPIQSESNPNPNPNPTHAQVREERFDKFWSAYPRKEAKPTARKSFDKIDPDDNLLETMLTAIEKWSKTEQWSDVRYIPHPATWLNQERWKDEPPKADVKPIPSPQRKLPAQNYEQRDYSNNEPDPDDVLDFLRGSA